MVRRAFQDLFNEEKDVAARADRFVFYCDDLLQTYKENIRSPSKIGTIMMTVIK